MTLIQPLDFQPVSGGPVIFLAGPIPFAPPWQEQAFDLICERASEVVVASPRRLGPAGRYTHIVPSGRWRFHRQRAWERYYMEVASRRGCILFWLPKAALPTDGAVYGATTRYELGLWSARYHDRGEVGICFGTDWEFPTVHTIAHDIEYEVRPGAFHETLEDTCSAAVAIARERFPLWEKAARPETEVETELIENTTIPRGQLRWQSGEPAGFLESNPMNQPDEVRRKALEMLKPRTDYSGMEKVAVETVGEDEASHVLALEEADSGEEERQLRVAEMRERGAWYLAGEEVPGPKYLAIGRSTYYIEFLQRLAAELHSPVYQSDYLDWIEPSDPHRSLTYCLDTAERIDVNLQGVSPEHLREATVAASRAVDHRSELPSHYMTSWEINQIYYGEYALRTFWHTGGAMSREEAEAILGEKVPRERIIETAENQVSTE